MIGGRREGKGRKLTGREALNPLFGTGSPPKSLGPCLPGCADDALEQLRRKNKKRVDILERDGRVRRVNNEWVQLPALPYDWASMAGGNHPGGHVTLAYGTACASSGKTPHLHDGFGTKIDCGQELGDGKHLKSSVQQFVYGLTAAARDRLKIQVVEHAGREVEGEVCNLQIPMARDVCVNCGRKESEHEKLTNHGRELCLCHLETEWTFPWVHKDDGSIEAPYAASLSSCGMSLCAALVDEHGQETDKRFKFQQAGAFCDEVYFCALKDFAMSQNPTLEQAIKQALLKRACILRVVCFNVWMRQPGTAQSIFEAVKKYRMPAGVFAQCCAARQIGDFIW